MSLKYTTDTIYLAEVLVLSRQEKSDSTVPIKMITILKINYVLDIHPLCFYYIFLTHVHICVDISASIFFLNTDSEAIPLIELGLAILTLQVRLQLLRPLSSPIYLDPNLIQWYSTIAPI